MRALLLGIMAGLLIGCVSAARTREAQCFGILMLDIWNSEQELDAMEGAWRTVQQARYERSLAVGESLVQSTLVADAGVPSASVALLLQEDRPVDGSQDVSEEQALYRRFVERRARHRETVDWYGRVAHRVETRLEKDEMLYPVLGMLATSTASIFYPIVRWNVRSVLWDGVDPDAEDDPVQRYCTNRLAATIRLPLLPPLSERGINWCQEPLRSEQPPRPSSFLVARRRIIQSIQRVTYACSMAQDEMGPWSRIKSLSLSCPEALRWLCYAARPGSFGSRITPHTGFLCHGDMGMGRAAPTAH